MPGLQARDRKHPGLPLQPGPAERREFEYIRPGTLAARVRRDLGSGPIAAPTLGPTRTEAECVRPLAGVVSRAPAVRRWPFVVDTGNIPCSARLGRCVAELSGSEDDWGGRPSAGLCTIVRAGRRA